MILRRGKQPTAITRLGRAIIEVRHGLQLVWQSIRSCFGSGAWRNEKPWLNDEGWKN